MLTTTGLLAWGGATLSGEALRVAETLRVPVLRARAVSAEDIHDSSPRTITHHNRGFITATDVLVEVRRDDITGTLLYSATLPALSSGAARVVTATLDPGDYTLFVQADPENAIPELDESNNLAVGIVAWPYRCYLPLVGKELTTGVYLPVSFKRR